MLRSRRRLAALLLALPLAGCAEGDALFTDAGSVQQRERELEAREAALEAERRRTETLRSQERTLRGEQAALDRQIAAEKARAAELRARLGRLDRQIAARRAGAAELAARERELLGRIDAVKGEIQVVERELAARPTQGQLVQLKRRLAELEQTYADLLTLYRAL